MISDVADEMAQEESFFSSEKRKNRRDCERGKSDLYGRWEMEESEANQKGGKSKSKRAVDEGYQEEYSASFER